MMKRCIEQKLRLRNIDARNERIETGAVVSNRTGRLGVERGQEERHQWKATGQCSRGDKCSFRHDSHDREKPTPKTAPSSDRPTPSGRSASRKRSLRGWSDYWHPPECQFQKSESGCEFCGKCSFAHRQVEGEPSKKLQKNGDKSAVAILKDVPQLGCVLQDTEQPEAFLKQKSCVQFEECNSQKLRSIMQAPEKTKIRHLEKFRSRFFISAGRTL